MEVSFIISTPLTHQGAVLVQSSEFKKGIQKEELNSFNFAIYCFYKAYNLNCHIKQEQWNEIETKYQNGTFIISVYWNTEANAFFPIMYNSNNGIIEEINVKFSSGRGAFLHD